MPLPTFKMRDPGYATFTQKERAHCPLLYKTSKFDVNQIIIDQARPFKHKKILRNVNFGVFEWLYLDQY